MATLTAESLLEGLTKSSDNKSAGSLYGKTKSDIERGQYDSAESFKATAMPSLVKGMGMRTPGVVEPIKDPIAIDSYARTASKVFNKCIHKGINSYSKTIEGMAPEIAGPLNALNSFSPQAMAMQSMSQMWSKELSAQFGKSISLTSPLGTGFVPFDLLPFARIIAPYYTPLRNKIARVPGQGTIHRGKIISDMTGALPNGLGTLQDDSTSEFFGGSGFASWPNPLPASGSQSAYDINIPQRFYALTESASWLAQFAGQGFDDAFGLASLLLIMEFFLLEEHDIFASTSQKLGTPTITAVARTAGSNETPLSGLTSGNLWIEATGLNYWGETVPSAAVALTGITSTQVVDVTFTTPSQGHMAHRIYGATAASTPGNTAYFPWTYNTTGGVVGGYRFTLQGAIPATGSNPPATDTGTGASTRAESLLSVLSGLASTGTGPYPTAANAGYYNPSVGDTLNITQLNTALQEMFNGANGYFANPSEILCEATDAVNLSNDIRLNNTNAYLLNVQQSEVAGVTAGVAVSNVVNPVTRGVPEILVHPYNSQGTAMLLSYTLPQTQNNLGNVMEVVTVQDVATIMWPVIDPAFRTSALRYSTFFMGAPQYCGLLQGLQKSAGTPYS